MSVWMPERLTDSQEPGARRDAALPLNPNVQRYA